ncbi:endonuclease [Brevibacillus reuszeri]|uniref:Endonuclease n=1 Tax=Brevibacillus reuszeri TaxID=54915 RepID=A0A0K9YIN0_9BACL|nr:endonuclease/exonuclease/phosphatase family protein [Brevibacillus reuszeri]KNB68548.1 hypothetical protein ADS79_31720 [Brevibacillus reuszeri]MED1858827.1 endonuclease/exonuclease/phosphatase family protein [Brevibacillus reuszeri]GED69042.1 endonuclease [Brevibacillus reuszeri]
MRKFWLPLVLLLLFIHFSQGTTLVHNFASSTPAVTSYYVDRLQVVTYNIRGCRDDQGHADPEKVVDALRPLSADVIALQEVDNTLPRSSFVNQVAVIARSLNMNYAFAPSIDFLFGTYGNAVLSKYPILHAASTPLPATREPRSLLDVTLDWYGSPLHVYATHLGVKASEHPEQIKSLYSYLQKKSSETGVLLGDFNMYADNSLLDSVRSLLQDPLYEKHIVLGTLKSKQSRKEIDHIFLSHDLQFLQATAPRIGPSDHYPVLMEIARRATKLA